VFLGFAAQRCDLLAAGVGGQQRVVDVLRECCGFNLHGKSFPDSEAVTGDTL
jgi:hypothetical protein